MLVCLFFTLSKSDEECKTKLLIIILSDNIRQHEIMGCNKPKDLGIISFSKEVYIKTKVKIIE